MATLKADVIAAAYSKLRISGLTVQPNPSDLELALGELENMMYEFATRGVSVGYVFAETPDPNDDLGAAREFWNMITTNLAIRLIPDFNKEVNQVLYSQAVQSFAQASAICARNRIQKVEYPTRQPVGSGNYYLNRWNRFYEQFNPYPPSKPEVQVITQGDTTDFTESFAAYLRTDEFISSIAVAADPGLTLVSSTFDGGIVSYRLTAPITTGAHQWQQVRITVVTSTGRQEVRTINFELLSYPVVG